MSYSVGYCVTQINGCKRTLKTLRDDLENLKSIIEVIDESSTSYKETVAVLGVSMEELNDHYKGNTARSHVENIKRIIDLCKDDSAQVFLLKSKTTEKMQETIKKIERVQNDLTYWENQLANAEEEAKDD